MTRHKNMKLCIIIQARLESTRLKNKILLPFHNGKPLINILIDRLRCNKSCIPVILSTTTNPADDDLVTEVENVLLFRGEEFDVLHRFISTMKKYNFTHAIRVCSDNPFLSLHYIDKLIEMTLDSIYGEIYDYIGYSIENGKPSIRSHIGYFAELVTLKSLERAYSLTRNKPFDREHVTYFIHSNPDMFKVKLIECDKNNHHDIDLSSIRLTLDTEKDFEILSEIYEILYKKNSNYIDFTLTDIISVLKTRPDMIRDMKVIIDNNTK